VRQPVGNEGTGAWLLVVQVGNDHPPASARGDIHPGKSRAESRLTLLNVNPMNLGANMLDHSPKHPLV